MLRSQGKQAQKLLWRCIQAGAQLVRTSSPVKALQIGQTHYAPMTCPNQLPQNSRFSYHFCFDQYIYSHREFATSNGEESNGEEVKQRGAENKKWWQSKIRQLGGLINSGTAAGSGAWTTKHYISDSKAPSQPPNTFASNGKPLASPYEETYPSSLIFRYKKIKIDRKTGNKFHNREDELNYLKQILVDEVNIQDPQMHLMLGFIKCGKTTLITQFLTNHYPDDYPPFIYLHLKEYFILSMEDFLNCLKKEILRVFDRNYFNDNRKWGMKQVNMGIRFGGEINVRAILERMESKEYEVKKSLIGDLRDLIHEVKQKDKKGRPFLIVIDEINSLKDILDMGEDKENLNLFKSFISMLEDVTKNKKTANVLFCSADSGVKFMFEGSGMDWDHYFRPFYIGFLNEEHMMKYFQEKIKLKKHLATVAWNYVGGDFNYWQNVAGTPYCLRSEEDFKKTFESQKSYAVAAVTPCCVRYGAKPTDEQVIILQEIYVLLKESAEKRDQKMVKYSEMCEIYGQKNIDVLVRAKGLFYILGKYISNDRTIEEKTPVLVAGCPIHQIAIDKYVENMKKKAKEKALTQSNKEVQKEGPKKGI